MNKILALDNDYEFEYTITQRNTATGALEVATGLTGLKGRLSATDGGAAIHSSLDVTAAERASRLGTYFGVLQGDDLRARAAGLIGEVGFMVFGDGTNVLVSEPHLILAVRRPG